MNALRWALRSTRHHWRVALGSWLFLVLAGAVVVAAPVLQDSVKAWLRVRLVGPLGSVRTVLQANGPFRGAIAAAGDRPAIMLSATAEGSNDLTDSVTIWGMDDGPKPGEVEIPASVAKDLGLAIGDTVFVRVNPNTGGGLGSPFANRSFEKTSVEVSARLVGLSQFALSLSPSLRQPQNVLVDRRWLASQLKWSGDANLVLSNGAIDPAPIRQKLTLADLGLNLQRSLNSREAMLASRSLLLTDDQIAHAKVAARKISSTAQEVSVALVTEAKHGGANSAYGMAAWVEAVPGVAANGWAATDLGLHPGDTLDLSLLKAHPDGTYSEVPAQVKVGAVTENYKPYLTPNIDGVTAAKHVSDWDAPFPVNMSRVTKRDDQYWDRYGAAPRYLLPRDVVAKAWNGPLTTGVLLGDPAGFERAFIDSFGKAIPGMQVRNLYQEASSAAEGSSDLGGLLLGMGSVLIGTALALAYSITMTGLKRREREIALLGAMGLRRGRIVGFLTAEGLIPSVSAALVSIPVGVLLAHVQLGMLGRLMPGGLGLSGVTVAWSPETLIVGAASVLVLSLVPYAVAGFRISGRVSAQAIRGLVPETSRSKRKMLVRAMARPLLVLTLLVSLPCMPSELRPITAGLALMVVALDGASLAWVRATLRPLTQLSRLTFALDRRMRNETPFLVASSCFLAAICLAFAIKTPARGFSVDGSTGGFTLIARTTHPVRYDLSTAEGCKKAGLTLPAQTHVFGLLESPGDDISCLNPAKPRLPRILGVPSSIIQLRPFTPAAWDLLKPDSKAVPVLGDAESIEWTLHSAVGQILNAGSGKIKIAGTLEGTVLADHLLTSETGFQRLFPSVEAPTFFLVTCPSNQIEATRLAIRQGLAQYGVDVRTVSGELDALHGVQNAYLSMFGLLAGISIVLGVVGSSLLVIREAQERRRELAILLAIGFSRAQVGRALIAGNLWRASVGVLVGTLCGGLVSFWMTGNIGLTAGLVGWMVGILVLTVVTTAACTRFALGQHLIQALRSEG